MDGGCIFCKTGFQQVISLSSIETEFIAAYEADKNTLYIYSILDITSTLQDKTITHFKDNQGIFIMANECQHTKYTIHMDITYDALHD